MRRLFLHPIVTSGGIAELYRQAFADGVELYVVSAYLRAWDTSLRLNSGCGAFAFIVGSDFGITRKKACYDVLKWLPRQRKPFFLVADAISGFHPKALFWRTRDGACYSLIGSSNLSDAGLNTNYEANAFAKLTANEFDDVREWIGRIRERSTPITKTWLGTYEEAPSSRKHKQGIVQHSLSMIPLPTFRGQLAVIHEWRYKKEQFAKTRARLLSAIRRCASGVMTSSNFYNTLENLWGSRPSRIQGWGWQVTGRDSDFGALCRGLIAIVDAAPAMRDFTVVKVVDELRKNEVETRRALLSELLCQFFPTEYPILNAPIASYVRPFARAPYGSSEGEKYVHLALSLRAALQNAPDYPAKDLLELDGMIWRFQQRKISRKSRSID